MAIAWGTIRLIITPWDGDGSDSILTTASENNLSQQDIWGFGQVVVLIFLLLPFLSFAGTLEPPHAFYTNSLFPFPVFIISNIIYYN
jgi:hypothetical protein